MWDYIHKMRPLTPKERSFLVDTLMIIEDSTQDPKVIKNEVRKHLLSTYKLKVMAAHFIIQGVHKGLVSAHHREKFPLLYPESISEKIQGKAFDREEIAARVRLKELSSFASMKHNPVLLAKHSWIKDFIRTQDKSWVELFLFTVTGRTTIHAGTEILILEAEKEDAVLCTTCTCRQELRVPLKHVILKKEEENLPPKTRFLNQLQWLMSQQTFEVQ